MELFSHYLLKIDQALTRELDLYSWSEFYAPLRYACNGGKRIRPLILLLCAESIKRKTSSALITAAENDDMYMAASAIELLHTESVIHDDIIDEEELRRGKPSFYMKHGYNNSILTADFVLGIILNIGSKINNSRVSRELSRAAIKMTDGEITEIKLCKRGKIEEDDYIKVLEHKTGSLFEASAKIGAILSGGMEDEIHAIATFGSLLGIAYQIHDDLIERSTEDRLFNLLVKKNDHSREFIQRMEDLCLSYSTRAKSELLNIRDTKPKRHLERLTDLVSLRF